MPLPENLIHTPVSLTAGDDVVDGQIAEGEGYQAALAFCPRTCRTGCASGSGRTGGATSVR